MPHPGNPLLTVQNPAITLQQLLYNITNPAILTDIMAVYEQTLNAGSKFQTDSILRTLAVKMNVLVTTQAQTNELHQQCVALVKAVADETLETLASSKALFATVNATDAGTDIYMHTKKLVADFEVVNDKIRLLLQHFMDDIFEESDTDIKSLSNKYEELNKLLADDAGQESWVLKTMQQDMMQLKAYSKKLSLAPAKQATITAYQLLPPFYTETAALYQLIVKKRAINPLISDSLLESSKAFVHSTEALIKRYNNWINLLYQYDQQLEELRNQIGCMGIIAGKAAK